MNSNHDTPARSVCEFTYDDSPEPHYQGTHTPCSPEKHSVKASLTRTAGWVIVVALSSLSASAAEPVDFNRDVRPLLSDRCFVCHGPDEEHREADLRLDQAKEMLNDRDGSPAVVPGNPDDSVLMQRIVSTDSDLRMPPVDSGKSLTPDEIDILRRWIADGATTSDHWAFVPPERHPIPSVERDDWPINWIDVFVLARLESKGLQPSPEADAVTLIRRLHFDLTGLPPAPATVERFIADPSEQTFEGIVEQLLKSDASAERLAVYWLDLVRYADTVGYHGDQDHPISPYRDWVIDAFASNMPFDQFTREQLAGDLLPDSDIDQKIASGYNRLLQTSHEGGIQPKEYLAIYAADRIRNLSVVWMGATVGCAQCHDHKFDPYTSRDFYSLVAFFADLDEDQHFYDGNNALPTKRAPELTVLSHRERQQLTELQSQLATNTDDETLKQLAESIDHLEKSARRTMISAAKEPRTIRVLPRGNWLDDSGDVVEPAIPSFLGTIATTSGNRATRLDLANWLTDVESGNGLLTARVFANRFWYLFFGQGLSASLDDFGGQGSPPDHPELLDRLALEFADSGWDVRHLLKQIVLSRTYRQSSAWTTPLQVADPENRWLARQSSMRLSAEMIRDNALQVSGLLVRDVGGPSVRPYQPVGYYRHLNFPERTYSHDVDARQWRRGIYVHWQRQFLHPMLKAFDAPSREECTAQRPQSNTPLAALTLMNDPTFVEAARAFAVRILSETETTKASDRLVFAFRKALSRTPDDQEVILLTILLEHAESAVQQAGDVNNQFAAEGLSSSQSEVDQTELAVWTMVTRTILNLDELITRY